MRFFRKKNLLKIEETSTGGYYIMLNREEFLMSFWVRQKGEKGTHLWLIDTQPELLLILIAILLLPVVFILVLLVKIPWILIIAGLFSVAAARVSLITRYIRRVRGLKNLTDRDSRFYITGSALIIAGVVLLLIRWLLT
jgi:hypothetical protein